MSSTAAHHELAYVVDVKGMSGRLHHLSFWVDSHEEVLRAARGRLPVPADAAHLPLHEAVRQAYEHARAGDDSAGSSTVADVVAAVEPAPRPDANGDAPGKPGG